MKKVKFIHGADIHLDSPMVGLKTLPENIFNRLQESTFRAFRHLIDSAIHHRVDFVILAGDIFDNEDRSVRAQVFLQREMERLAEVGIKAYLVHGNHDHLRGNWNQITFPSNVHVFGETVETMELLVNNAVVHLHGFSYHERHVLERKITHYEQNAGVADFQIGILHGNMEGSTDHGNYAPFQIKELLEKSYHYWALGHIHKRAILHEDPPIVYSGNTQGRNKKEKGKKGCYLVTLHESGSHLEFIETGDVIWNEILLDVSNIISIDKLLEAIREQMNDHRREGKGILTSLIVKNLDLESTGSFVKDELLEMIQEDEKEESSFVWPISIHMEEKIHWTRDELAGGSDFYGELFQVINEFENIEETLASLYNHHHARKFLSSLSKDEIEEIRSEAETRLIKYLLSNE